MNLCQIHKNFYYSKNLIYLNALEKLHLNKMVQFINSLHKETFFHLFLKIYLLQLYKFISFFN